jgi:hypothetical protein
VRLLENGDSSSSGENSSHRTGSYLLDVLN